ncbi:codanin-1 isoform X1 [Octopus bimaculoides]|uniref:Codanin-1 C-terminal domain-containing protein n=1 Tax=Octopus bimaculoides TaxID=37653 RepID=A0A0L8HEE3_OCTBM|nr:codanin-1 isoform X1 [Octopus bimaculoides]XP_052829742.1 codanin-1 isoform X1 [Octopus bimaculoides]
MAAVLDALLDGKCVPLQVIQWMKMETHQPLLPEILINLQYEKKEFIPYFLNYLRDQTFHLLHNSKSVSPSPSKCDSSTPVATSKRSRSSCTRTQLFPNSDFCRNSDNYAENFPKLNAETSSDHLVTSVKSCLSNTTLTTVENLAIRKRSKKVPNKKMFYPIETAVDNNKEVHINSVNIEKDSSSCSSCKLSNQKKRNWKTQHTDKKCQNQKHKLESSGYPRNQVLAPFLDQAVNKYHNCMKPSRRIKPTPVQAGMERKQNQAFIESSENKCNSISLRNEENKHNGLSTSFQEERALLKIEKAKLLEAATVPWNITPSSFSHSPIKNSNVEQGEMIEANLSLVTNHKKLDTLSQIYSECLYAALFPSLTVEIFFLVQLLVAKISEKAVTDSTPDNCSGHNYLKNIHNIVYFSVQALQNLLPLLPLLGKTILRLLCDNPRIGHFSLSLKSILCQLHETDCSSLQMSPVLLHCSIGGVPFQAETDNRNNFPSPKAFSTFRAQRDHFYELIREWKDNHEKPQWSLTSMLNKKMHLVLSPDSELANYWHLAKLFVSQLIIMYHEDNNMSLEGDEDSISFLSQLRKSNPEKFKLYVSFLYCFSHRL